MNQLVKCIYFVLTEYRFLISKIDQSCSMELDNSMGTLIQYWYDIGILKILVFLKFWYQITMWVLWLCVSRLIGFYFCKSRTIVEDREYETGFQYDILRWVSDWKGTVQILVDTVGRLFLMVLGGDLVDYRQLVRFFYDNSYHKGLSMTMYKALCNNHASYLGNGQDQTSISLQISGHKR